MLKRIAITFLLFYFSTPAFADDTGRANELFVEAVQPLQSARIEASASNAKVVAFSCDQYKGRMPEYADPNDKGPYKFEIDLNQNLVSEVPVFDGFWSAWYRAEVTDNSIKWSNDHQCNISFDQYSHVITITFPNESERGFWSNCSKITPRNSN